jgi:type IV pilus assembly protein PilE
MVTVSILGILAALTWPSYIQQVIRGRRSSAKAAMMDLANREQQYLVANRSYAYTATLQTSGYTPPSDVSQYYTWSVNQNPDTTGFLITFTPIGVQASDGALTLDQAGIRTPLGKWQR